MSEAGGRLSARNGSELPYDVLAILGPTAVGKTAIATAVARAIGGEVISADSRQAYRGLQVGTAAPSPAETEAVPHHGIGFLEPGERYGAGRFARLARSWIGQIRERGGVPIVVGGTGFFVRALTNPVFGEPDLDSERRARLDRWLAGRSLEEVRRWALRLDPGLQARIAVPDRQRVCRAIEISLLTGRSLDWWYRHAPPEAPPIRARTWVLDLGADSLRQRIRVRAERLLEEGWREEVIALARAGHGPGSPAMSSIGYGHVLDLVEGRISRDAAVQAIVRDTWRYARRQRTWFRHQLPSDAQRVDVSEDADRLVATIVSDWRRMETRSGGAPDRRPAERPGVES